VEVAVASTGPSPTEVPLGVLNVCGRATGVIIATAINAKPARRRLWASDGFVLIFWTTSLLFLSL
jgi:hypothetical protein